MKQEVQRKQENERKDEDCIAHKIHYNKNNIPRIFQQSGSWRVEYTKYTKLPKSELDPRPKRQTV